GAAQILLGLARIDIEVERHLDGLVEFGAGARLHHLHRLGEGIIGVAVDAFGRLLQALSLVSHGSTPPPRGPSTGRSRRSCAPRPRCPWRSNPSSSSGRCRGSASSSPCRRCPCPASASPCRCRPPSSGNRSWAATW